MFILIS